ncbi:MAG: MinD/ParA family protein [Chloroflexi bacterium]|nr:MinD/ParA family protein [Chloroflexota bacterium]
MSKIISVHSFRGGTGKSNTTANITALLASQGLRVGVIDTDIQSPGIHVLFGLDEDDMGRFREGYDVGLLNDGFHDLVENLNLDVLMIDTHPGLNEETLLSIAISDALIIILRPDSQDYQGTGVTVEVARKLNVPRLLLLVNKVPEVFNFADVQKRVEETYHSEVAAVLPHSDEMMALASSGIFALRYPDHKVTQALKQVAAKLMA